ncbi:MAG: peptidase M48, partial [Planctomycetes bacterium]|nr:peptidase M48 [Planctomycetota bacterium]
MPLDEELSICVEPLPYHRRLVEHFQKSEKELWKWICSPEQQQNIDAESFRLELLKSTYRLDEQSHPVLFQTIDELRKLMRIDAAVFVYQSQGTGGVNASLAFLPGEAHIILMGPVLTLVTPDELMALLAHELGHYLFLSQQNGEYLHASELIRSLSNDVVAGIEHVETARLWNLYTELFCDRWAFAVSKDLGVAVRTLVKAQTGLSDVNAESYLRQAAEIFASGPIKAGAKEFTHPELYIRARALELWSQQGNDSQSDIESLIEGKLDLQQLDMLSQHTASEFTVALLDEILRPKW